MRKSEPNLLQIARAPFLSSIVSPIAAGTLLAIIVTKEFDPINFLLLLIIGIGLHAATNIYNDIYDTLQGTDMINTNRNEFSGGSGFLVYFPHLKSRMYRIARLSLVIAFLGTLILNFRIADHLRITLWCLYGFAAFFSKFYTAEPVKLAYRGLGEVSVWFAFGPMAILFAAISQNVACHPVVISAMPITGISTLSILLIGQMIDYEADKEAGKWGIAVRKGLRAALICYIIVQSILMINVILLAVYFIPNGLYLLVGLIPYMLFFNKSCKLLSQYTNIESLKKAAQINVQIHLLFALLFNLGLLLVVMF
ncbi:prenyltransferase [candidate division KSB1 bacterium]|nr:prenyltransferase [candidate division KSB1 bacterium]